MFDPVYRCLVSVQRTALYFKAETLLQLDKYVYVRSLKMNHRQTNVRLVTVSRISTKGCSTF